jgi:hypothetical protein
MPSFSGTKCIALEVPPKSCRSIQTSYDRANRRSWLQHVCIPDGELNSVKNDVMRLFEHSASGKETTKRGRCDVRLAAWAMARPIARLGWNGKNSDLYREVPGSNICRNTGYSKWIYFCGSVKCHVWINHNVLIFNKEKSVTGPR